MAESAATIQIYGPDHMCIAWLTKYDILKWQSNWHTPDSWEMRVPAHVVKDLEDTAINVDPSTPEKHLFELGGFVSCVVAGGERKFGSISIVTRSFNPAEGVDFWAVGGPGLEAAFGRRACMSAITSNWLYKVVQITGTVEHCARELVKSELTNPAKPARAIPEIRLEISDESKTYKPSAGRKAEDYVFESKPLESLDQALERLSRYSDLAFKLRWTGADDPVNPWQFEFATLQGADRRDEVILSPQNGSVLAYEVTEASTNTANTVFVVGRWLGAAWTTAVETLGIADHEHTGFARTECAIDGSDSLLSSGLRERGRRHLIDNRDKQIIKLGYNRHCECCVIGRDFFLGDKVTLDLDPKTIVSRVISVTDTWDLRGGHGIELGVGHEAPDLRSVFDRFHRQDQDRASTEIVVDTKKAAKPKDTTGAHS
ncbi:MAG: hypothetical protein METHP_01485 [Methanoregula sp. SKADARSKE-2]|nr:MAG: hypothetical protein METHP_01485 [Methanoregula sp. SKADARSKE-2]